MSVAPIAPAPIDEIVTNTPIAAPTIMVASFKREPVGRSFGLSWTHFNSFVLNSNDAAVKRTEMPMERLMKWLKFFETGPTNFNKRIEMIAVVMLPVHKRRTISQRTFPCSLCAAVPKPLVMAAKAKSVPTAVVGATPKIMVSSGVMSDPPPTPVMPTKRPTNAPEIMKCEESIKNWIMLLISQLCKWLLKLFEFYCVHQK